MPGSAAPENQNPFVKVAAKVCLLVPFVVIGLSSGYSVSSKSLTGRNLQLFSLGFVGVSCLLLLAALIMGITAMVLMKAGSRKAVVSQSLAGIVISGVLLGLVVHGYLDGRAKAQAKNKAYAVLSDTTKDFNEEAIASIKNHREYTNNIDALQKSLSRAAAATSGDDALILQAGQAFAARIAVLQKSYQQSTRELNAAMVLSTSNLVDRSDLQRRRVLVQNFLKCNDDVKTSISNNQAYYRLEMTARKVPPDKLEQAMNDFIGNSGAQSKLTQEIRDCDDRMGGGILGVLNLLDDNWGHWKFIEQTGRLRFESQAVADQYNVFMRQISQAHADQVASQKQVAGLIQQQSAPPTLH